MTQPGRERNNVYFSMSRPRSVNDGISNGINQNTEFKDYDTCALSSDNILLSGTQLKNTEKVYAVCTYGGSETKVRICVYFSCV